MKFKEGTTVYTADGDKVGDIERFVLDPRERKVIGLVVRKGFLFTEDKVIPMDKIDTQNPDRVVLRTDVDVDKDLPPYEQTHYVAPTESEVSAVYEADYFDPIYYNPPPRAATWYVGGVYGAPSVPVAKKNIPEEAVVLEEGADVISRDGENVGDIAKVYTDDHSGEITHFSVKQGLLFTEEKVIPAGWVEDLREEKVRLAVNAKTLEKLGDI